MSRTTETTTSKGRESEALAVTHLVRLGYQVRARNYRCRGGEIDIIADDERGVLCFVEVRSVRSAAHGTPLETVGRQKQARLARAARHYLAARGGAAREVRFDAVGITFEPEVRIDLVRGAFEPGWHW